MRQLTTLCLLLALSVLVACPVPATAQAATGSYGIAACNYAPGGINRSWVSKNNDSSPSSHYATHENCPYPVGGIGGTADQEGGLSTTDELGLSNGAPPGTSAGWTFTAPNGTTIAGITYERYIGHIFDPNNYWSPALRADGTILTEETCLDTIENGGTCLVGGPPGHGGQPSTITGLSAHELTLGILCQAPSEQECVTGATQHKAWATMYGTTVTLNDPTPPTLSTPTGSLWGTGETNGFHKATESVTITAEDVGGGVRNIALAADGHTLDTYTSPCDFTIPQPCPSSTGPQTLSLATTKLSDGPHVLELVSTDAAENKSTTLTEQIVIDNTAPLPPLGLMAAPTQPGGSTFLATWTDPAEQVAPITTATYQLCPVSSPGECSTPATAPPTGPMTVTLPRPGTWTLKVWLSDAASNTNPNDPANTSLTVPVDGSNTGSANSGNPKNDDSNNGNGNSGGSRSSTPKMSIRLTEKLHGHDLIVQVNGKNNADVRISWYGRYRGKQTGSGTRKITLKHGQSKTIFKLNTTTVKHATITVTASLAHEQSISSTLRTPFVNRPTRFFRSRLGSSAQ